MGSHLAGSYTADDAGNPRSSSCLSSVSPLWILEKKGLFESPLKVKATERGNLTRDGKHLGTSKYGTRRSPIIMYAAMGLSFPGRRGALYQIRFTAFVIS
jgi:hypothetical protein